MKVPNASKKTLKLIGALAFTFHAFAITVINFPPQNALQPYLSPIVQPYVGKLAQNQWWDMFDTIPYDHEFRVRTVAIDANGGEHEIEPLAPLPWTMNAKALVYFYRIHPQTHGSDAAWLNYFRATCSRARGILADQNRPPLLSLRVEFIREVMRSLVDIRRTGELTNQNIISRGPTRCESN